ncbi:PREDICTED: WD repeat-containing protein on Y chromosome-like [Atta cephalotes]|uniref:WD repeat-containing protein on Y chromosome n=1 Tax=Atta cephalotes TaxID=12957 RepID=A0A158NWD3_ATTCE|nr:PREDICTED: WD repeat-containing protein on Y chromosome-like [Atta cephalotes]
MDSSQLYDAFRDILEIKMSQDEFQVLFNKIDMRLNGKVTWDEFISYLLIEFRDIDTSLRSQILETPLMSLPKLSRTHHRTPVCRITFCPEVLPDRSTSFRRGCYLTVSREGVINYWSLDLNYERTVQSKNPFLKVQSTAITDMIVLPDVQMVCTSSTECDLRFYDVAAKKFELRLLISSLENAVVCMHYYFSRNMNENSYIVLGDTSGSIIIMAFNPMDRGPFKQYITSDLIIFRYDNVIKVCFIDIVEDFAENYFAKRLLQLGEDTRIRCHRIKKYTYKLDEPESHVLVTGGPDCVVRVWNPFVPRKANAVLLGHRSTICALVITNAGNRIFSLSKDRCIKVWDVPTLSCIQTYSKLPRELSEHTPMTVVFNTLTCTMIIASMMIAVLVCEHVINEEISDGYTHTKGVSCVLYNQLFRVIVSTGLDSCIIVWDPWYGRRLHLISHAHSVIRYGQYADIEITAACFDDSEQFLVTGARNGSVKMWNYNTGICIHDIMIDHQCEITNITWYENRILCCGWNKHVTELSIFESDICKKNWTTSHTDDILCLAARYPQLLATGSYNEELILWNLETGQPFRKYQVTDVNRRNTRMTNAQKEFRKLNEISGSINQQLKKLTPCVHQESALNIVRVTAVRAIIFLAARETKPDVGTLLVALDSGLIQVWTHHPAAGFLGAFSVIHTVGDCATSLATDPENQFFITGHSIGYIKVWLLSNYMLPNPPKICMPLLRLEFPFLWKDKIDGRAKRAVRNQMLPLLLSSVRGHTRGITSLQIISSARVIISGSADRTVRLWSYGGRYISTLGTFRDWIPILPTVPVQKYFEDYKLPADIKGFASSTTLKVLHGGMKRLPIKIEEKEIDISKETLEGEQYMLYGKEFDSLVLETYYESQLPGNIYQKYLQLDNTLSYIRLDAY